MALRTAETYTEHFQQVVAKFPDRVAFRQKTPQGYRETTYGEVYRKCTGIAGGLVAMGLKPGARVAIISENRPEWVMAYLGIYFAGGTAVPLDAQISASEWRTLIDDSEAQRVFVSGLMLAKAREALQDSHLVSKIVCFDPVEGDREARSELDGFIEWASSLSPAPQLPATTASDVVVIIYTSGTTGKPKGVMLTQANILGEIRSAQEAVRLYESEVLLCLLPLQHVFASIVNVLLPLYLGAQVTFIDTLKRTEIMEALQQAGITILATVPQFFYLFHGRIEEELGAKSGLVRVAFRSMMRLNRFCLDHLHLNPGRVMFARVHRNFGRKLRLFVSGGSAFDPKVAQDFHDLGFTILQGYGLTETTGGCTITPIESNVIGSVGPAMPGHQVEICEPNEEGIGEVRIRGPVVMKGYYKNPSRNTSAVADGFL